jgi:hypothetical protein
MTEIRGQFHQHSTRSFYVRNLCTQLFCTYVLGLYFTGVSLLAQKLCVECWWNWTQGLISPKIFAKQKVADARHLEKNSKFNFTNKVVRLKLSQNSPKYVHHLPNNVCQKWHQILRPQKVRLQMLMKSTPGDLKYPNLIPQLNRSNTYEHPLIHLKCLCLFEIGVYGSSHLNYQVLPSSHHLNINSLFSVCNVTTNFLF